MTKFIPAGSGEFTLAVVVLLFMIAGTAIMGYHMIDRVEKKFDAQLSQRCPQ